MSDDPIVRNVFIDTQYFDSINYSFSVKALKELVRLVEEGGVRVFLTSVTLGEMRSHVVEHMKEAANALKSFKDKGRFFRNLPSLPVHGAFEDFNLDEATKQALQTLDDFTKGARITVLDLSHILPDPVFEKYFAKQPPFGEGKKKSEFPDAFAFAVLDKWCDENKQGMIVVSGDSDWKSVADQKRQMHWLPKVDDLIDEINQERKIAAEWDKFWDDHLGDVISAISAKFEGSEFHLVDEEGDVDGVTVTQTKLGEPALLEAEVHVATFSVTVEIAFEAEVTYEDFDSGVWDGVDKEWAFVPTREKVISKTAEFEAEVVILLERDALGGLISVNMEVDFRSEFGLTVRPTDYEMK
jgi:hypothetical protein